MKYYRVYFCYYEKVGNDAHSITDEILYDIPNNWCFARLGDIGDWGAGVTPQRGKKEYYNGNILWIKTGELNNGYIFDSIEKITEKALKECSLRYNSIGDILIAMYGATIGKLGIVGKELTTNQACCACTPNNGIFNLYLFYYLMSQKEAFIKLGSGGAQPNISRDKIIKYIIPIPTHNEQIKIVETIDKITKILKGEN